MANNVIAKIRHLHDSGSLFRYLFIMFIVLMTSQFLLPSHFVYLIGFYGLIVPALLAALFFNKQHIKKYISGKYRILWAIFFAYLIGHVFFSFSHYPFIFVHLKAILTTGLFVLLASMFFYNGRYLNLFLESFIHCGALSGLIAIIFYLLRNPLGERLVGFALTDHAILGGGVYAVAILMAIYQLFQLPRQKDASRRDTLKKILYIAEIGLLTSLVMFTISKGLIIALIITVLVLTALCKRWWVFSACMIGLVSLSALIAHLWFPIIPELGDWLHSSKVLHELVERGSSFRFQIWHSALMEIADHPWSGHTPLGHFPTFSHPHNLLLSTAYYYGILPTVILGILLLSTFIIALRIKHNLSPLIISLLLYSIILTMTDFNRIVGTPHDEGWTVIWLPITMIFGLTEALKASTSKKRVKA